MIFNIFKKKDKTHRKMSGKILDFDDNTITIALDDASYYKKNNYIIIGIPVLRNTARGEVIPVSDIVACGDILEVDGNNVKIRSQFNGPIIARLTVKEKLGQACEMIINKVV